MIHPEFYTPTGIPSIPVSPLRGIIAAVESGRLLFGSPASVNNRIWRGSFPLSTRKTMSQYQKKPTVVEAFQMTKERRADPPGWPSWLIEAWQKDIAEAGAFFPRAAAGILEAGEGLQVFIRTLAGVREVSWGDYIIQGVKGEIYPCKPDIFELTYDPVESTTEGHPASRPENVRCETCVFWEPPCTSGENIPLQDGFCNLQPVTPPKPLNSWCSHHRTTWPTFWRPNHDFVRVETPSPGAMAPPGAFVLELGSLGWEWYRVEDDHLVSTVRPQGFLNP